MLWSLWSVQFQFVQPFILDLYPSIYKTDIPISMLTHLIRMVDTRPARHQQC